MLKNIEQLPISHICNRDFCNFSKYNSTMSKNKFHSVLFKNVELIDKSVKNEMSLTKAELILDG